MRLFLVVFAAMLPAIAAAAECTARSRPTVTPVVELYTSEGCSSCPPADRWLSQLAPEAAAGRVVPLGFHVDYWDYIGWRDPFASKRATERQRQVQSTAGARYVYTPQVVVGGRDFRAWHSSAVPALAAIGSKPATASIELVVKADSARGIGHEHDQGTGGGEGRGRLRGRDAGWTFQPRDRRREPGRAPGARLRGA